MFTENGIINTLGQFFSCKRTEHIATRLTSPSPPHVMVIGGDTVMFEDFYTCDHTIPTQAQYETVMDWCAATGERFEDVTDCWREPWRKWRGDD